MNLNSIGFFQFNNLVKNRVPFLFVAIGVDFEPHFSGMDRAHLKKNELVFAEGLQHSDIVGQLKDRATADHAVICLCPAGDISKAIVENLEKLGYRNAFWVHGGLSGLLQQKLADEF